MLEEAKRDAIGCRVLEPAIEQNPDAPLRIGPELTSVLETQLRQPGDVTTILEERDQFEVLRLIERTDVAWDTHAVRFQKLEFETWLAQEMQSPSPGR